MENLKLLETYNIEDATEADSVGVAEVFISSSATSYAQLPGADEEWLQTQLDYLKENYGPEEMRHRIAETLQPYTNKFFLVAKDEKQGDKVVAFMDGRTLQDEAWVDGLYVSSEAQGRNIGSRLIEQAIALADQLPLKLEVMEFNSATEFYQKLGFVLSDEEPIIESGKPKKFIMKRDPEAQL